MLLLASLALAGNTLVGDALRVAYNSGGTWNDSSVGSGLQALVGQDWVEFTYAGETYAMFSLAYTAGGESRAFWANSALGNSALVLEATDESSPVEQRLRHDYLTTELTVVKTESFPTSGHGMIVRFYIVNDSDTTVSDLRLALATDPDPEVASTGAYETLNDAIDLDGDGTTDWSVSTGATTGAALALGGCGELMFEAGHFADWTAETGADMALVDGAGALGDWAAGVRYSAEVDLDPGEGVAVAFLVGTGEGEAAAMESTSGLCCDIDGDGHDGADCGGDDCDDAEPSAFPGGVDTPYDGIDGDCVGGDDDDLDGDGYAGVEAGGDDCDDGDAAVNPGAEEVWHDGTDQDCDGQEDDEDGDGYSLARDCDDTDPSIYEDCPEADKAGVSAEGDCGCSTATSPVLGAVLAASLLARRRLLA
ncbi:MAG: hypothetical protein FJ102_06100 [Deltaproteobacteria bacterium]|nr:hypothetical protein [Deltaproteobacteria bacterium]